MTKQRPENRCPWCGKSFLSRHECPIKDAPPEALTFWDYLIPLTGGAAAISFIGYCVCRIFLRGGDEPFFAGKVGEVMGAIGLLFLLLGWLALISWLVDIAARKTKIKSLNSDPALVGAALFWLSLIAFLVVLSVVN